MPYRVGFGSVCTTGVGHGLQNHRGVWTKLPVGSIPIHSRFTISFKIWVFVPVHFFTIDHSAKKWVNFDPLFRTKKAWSRMFPFICLTGRTAARTCGHTTEAYHPNSDGTRMSCPPLLLHPCYSWSRHSPSWLRDRHGFGCRSLLHCYRIGP